ncbi:MAG: hypothetical protein KBA95_12055 [Acidobacteria bacterium]|nr:hypothetical protein [Acidobacteriota bacterium]
MSDAFAAAELARSRYVDPARTSEAARTLAFLPGYVERVAYFAAKKAVDHALRILSARPDWPDLTVIIPVAGEDHAHTITRARLIADLGAVRYPVLLHKDQVLRVTAP